MAGITPAFAVQSYCFRTIKTNEEVAQAVKDIGLGRIEVCRVHCNFDEADQHEACIETYRAADVAICSMGVEGMSDDDAANRNKFEFCKKAGIKHMSVDFNPATIDEALKSAQALAEEYDVKCGIHNHGGRHWLGNSQTLNHVFSKAGDRIGLCLDTAWALDAGENPVKMVERFGDRLFAIHMKDFTFDSARKHTDVVVGTGALDLPGLIEACDQVGFAGEAILEYEGDPDNPVPTLKNCVEAIRKSL